MFILCTSRHTYSLLIRNMYLYDYELHILYIINNNKQDIPYSKNDLTCEKIVYSINNKCSNLFQSSVITFHLNVVKYYNVFETWNIASYLCFHCVWSNDIRLFSVLYLTVWYHVVYNIHFHCAVIYVYDTYSHLN